MKTFASIARFGSGILAGLTLLMLSAAAGCNSGAPQLAAGEEPIATEPIATESVDAPVDADATAAVSSEVDADAPAPDLTELTDLTDLSELTELEPTVVVVPPPELLKAARKALLGVQRGVTKKTSEKQLQEAAARGIESLEDLLGSQDATAQEIQQAWDMKVKLEYHGTQRRWAGFTDRLIETRNRLWGTEFSKEAEYANSFFLKMRWFGPDVPVWKAVEKLTEHALTFPAGVTPVRMFLSYATELTKRRDYANAKSICQIALFNLKDHPEERSIEEYLGKLESPNSRGVRVTSRDNTGPQIKRRKDRIQKDLEHQVKEMKSMLPIQLDPITRLDKVTAGWHSIRYSYTVTGATREVLKKRAAIQKRVSAQLRTTFATQLLLDDGVQFNYRYFDTKGSLLFRFSVSK